MVKSAKSKCCKVRLQTIFKKLLLITFVKITRSFNSNLRRHVLPFGFKRLDSMAILGCPSGPWNISTPAFAGEKLVSQNIISMPMIDIEIYAEVIIEFAHRLCKDTPSISSNKSHKKMWVMKFPDCMYMRLAFFCSRHSSTRPHIRHPVVVTNIPKDVRWQVRGSSTFMTFLIFKPLT